MVPPAGRVISCCWRNMNFSKDCNRFDMKVMSRKVDQDIIGMLSGASNRSPVSAAKSASKSQSDRTSSTTRRRAGSATSLSSALC
jgi:hypothetical protein